MHRRKQFMNGVLSILCFTLILSSITVAYIVWISEEQSQISMKMAGSKLLNIGNPTFDFGKLVTGQIGKNTWNLQNVGKESLEIRAQSSCACTVTNVPGLQEMAPPLVIEPGRGFEIEVKWQTWGKLGSFKQVVSLYTNDPSNKIVRLEIRGEIIPPILLSPNNGELRLTDESNQGQKDGQIEVVRFDGKVMKLGAPLLEKVSSIEVGIIDSPGVQDTRAKSVVLVKIRNNAPVGLFKELLMMPTGDPTIPEISMHISGRVIGDGTIKVFPEELVSTSASKSVAFSASADIKVVSTELPRFTIARAPLFIHAKLDEPAAIDKNLWRINLNVYLPPSEKARVVDGEILLQNFADKSIALRVPLKIFQH